MTEVSTTVIDGSPRMVRAARALIGWLPPEQAHVLQQGNVLGVAPTEEIVRRAAAARDAVSARQAGVEQDDALAPAPAELDDHIAAVRARPEAQPFVAEGWNVCLVDLRRVCAAQPTVHVDQAAERVRQASADGLLGLARVTLPIPTDAPLATQFDQARNIWTLSSPNPNLRIMQPAKAKAEAGFVVLGFLVGVLPSFLQVARFQGRLILRDGYHRAVGLLQRGIHVVPAFTRDFGLHDDLGLPAVGMLPQGAYLGPRPPLLPDYLDDTVSTSVQVPAVQKVAMIQGIEISMAG